METENMGKITIGLGNEAEKKLRERAKRNMRSISKEVEWIILTIEKPGTGIFTETQIKDGNKWKKIE